MPRFTFPPHVAALERWMAASEAALTATVFGIIGIGLYFWADSAGGVLDGRPWYVGLPVFYLSMSCVGLMFWFVPHEEERRKNGGWSYEEDVFDSVRRMDEAAIRLKTERLKARALYWNPLVWPFRLGYLLLVRPALQGARPERVVE